MKKILLAVLAFVMMGVGQSVAQEVAPFEGESTSKVFSSQKMTAMVTTKNFLAKAILKSVMKKYTDDNPMLYNGMYTQKSVIKGNKTRAEVSHNNSVIITITEPEQVTTITYYNYLKKGYTMVAKINPAQVEQMRNSEVEKTGETVTIMGKKCDVYKQKYQKTTDTLETVTNININNEYAVCEDYEGMPEMASKMLNGVTGCPLKFTTNTVTQTTNKMLNMDIRLSIATEITSITPRAVDDSEFDVPSDIKLIDGNKDAKKMFKIAQENIDYMKKNNLWVDPALNEDKIYDNLNEEWDF
jgi:hypothetical protein